MPLMRSSSASSVAARSSSRTADWARAAATACSKAARAPSGSVLDQQPALEAIQLGLRVALARLGDVLLGGRDVPGRPGAVAGHLAQPGAQDVEAREPEQRAGAQVGLKALVDAPAAGLELAAARLHPPAQQRRERPPVADVVLGAVRVRALDPAPELVELRAREVQQAPHAPGLRAGHRPADALLERQAGVAALQRLLRLAQVPEHGREVGQRRDADVARRLLGLIRPRVVGVGRGQVLARAEEVADVHRSMPWRRCPSASRSGSPERSPRSSISSANGAAWAYCARSR